MTLDERLEALVTSTELMSGMLKDVLANIDKLSANMERIDSTIEKLSASMDKLTTTMETLVGHMGTLAQVVINHEGRLKRLEAEGPTSSTS